MSSEAQVVDLMRVHCSRSRCEKVDSSSGKHQFVFDVDGYNHSARGQVKATAYHVKLNRDLRANESSTQRSGSLEKDGATLRLLSCSPTTQLQDL